MMEESLLYASEMEACVTKMGKINLKIDYLRKRDIISRQMFKEEGYLLFDELKKLGGRTRDILIENTDRSAFILYMAILQSTR